MTNPQLPMCTCWNSFDAWNDDGTPHTGDDCKCYCHGVTPYLDDVIGECAFWDTDVPLAIAHARELADNSSNGNSWCVVTDSTSHLAMIVAADHASRLTDGDNGQRFTIVYTAPSNGMVPY